MKFLKKRLPALLLALIIAVMPVFLAVPARADVLSGSDSIYTEIGVIPADGYSVRYLCSTLDDVDKVCAIIYEGLDHKEYLLFASTINYSGSDFSIVASGSVLFPVLSISYGEDDSTRSLLMILDLGEPEYAWSFSDTAVCEPLAIFGFTLVSDSDSEVYPLSLSDYGGGDGVLSVFSGVGSWFTGAVGNMTSMFWTADGGLSVLGVLAVASLAIAVIVLFVYLIAGWLKFK